MTLLPASAVNVPALQVIVALDGVATTTLAGRLSVKARLDAASVPVVLSIVKVSVLVLPVAIEVGEKLLLKPGGGLTVNVALVVPLLPRDDIRSPVVLTCEPGVLLVTSTVTVQLVPVATVPPV